jgi:hypothetical protein
MKRAGRILLILAGLGGAAYIATQVLYTRVPDSRLAAAAMQTESAGLRTAIAQAAEKRGSLRGVGRSVPTPQALSTQYGAAAVAVADDGRITLRGEKFGLTLEFVPVLEAGEVKWRCSGAPEHDMPLACRAGG